MKYTKDQIKKVTQQIVNMLVNDIIEENRTESFIGWCADGEVFQNYYGNVDEGAWSLAQEIADAVDELVYTKLDPDGLFR